jgi:hypothetical protein
LSNTTGTENAGLGTFSLFNKATGSSNTATGSQVLVANTTATENTANGTFALSANTDGSVISSSARSKEDIKPLGKSSAAIPGLKPVNFRYKKEIDPQGIPEFGLIAEEVEKVNLDLIIRDREVSLRASAMNRSMRCYSMSFSKNIAR